MLNEPSESQIDDVHLAAKSGVGRVIHARKQGDIDFLIGSLTDTDQHVRWVAANELGELRATSAVDDLLRWAEDASDDTFRAACVVALGKIGDVRAIDALHGIASDSSTWFGVRTQAMAALGVLGDRRAVPMLVAVVTDQRLLETFQRRFMCEQAGTFQCLSAMLRSGRESSSSP